MMREAEVQRAILLAFGARPGLRIWRQNTGVAEYTDDQGRRQFVKFGDAGQADIIGNDDTGAPLVSRFVAPHHRDILRAYRPLVPAH